MFDWSAKNNSKKNSIKIDKIILTQRKTISLEISVEGLLTVRAPRNSSLTGIEKLVATKEKWITESKQRMYHQNLIRNHQLSDNHVIFLGDRLQVALDSQMSSEIALITDRLFINPEHNPLETCSKRFAINKILVQWFSCRCYEIVKLKCDYYSELLSITYNRIRITNARKRWGSCSFSNNLNFSWRVVMTPMHIIEYVVLHEIMHIRHKNHGSNFWSDIAELMPDFKIRRGWLRQHNYLSTVDFDYIYPRI